MWVREWQEWTLVHRRTHSCPVCIPASDPVTAETPSDTASSIRKTDLNIEMYHYSCKTSDFYPAVWLFVRANTWPFSWSWPFQSICPCDTSWSRSPSRDLKSISTDEFMLHQIYLCQTLHCGLLSCYCAFLQSTWCKEPIHGWTLDCVYWWVGFVA